MGEEAVRLLLDEVDAIDSHDNTPEPVHRVLETSLVLPTDGHGLDDEAAGVAAAGFDLQDGSGDDLDLSKSSAVSTVRDSTSDAS
jgi:hypothetical protein